MHEVTRHLVQQLLERLTQDLQEAEAAREGSLNDAIEAEGAMVSRYDTFKEEAQYLAAGHSRRAVELLGAVNNLRNLIHDRYDTSRRVVAGSLVTLRRATPPGIRRYVLLPGPVGGYRLVLPGTEEDVQTVSIQAPLGQALLRKEAGDPIEFRALDGDWEVTETL
jgi:transcription elongation GreA/GreB family factor